MQLTLKTLVLAVPAILAIHTAAAAIPQVQRDVQEDSPEAIIAAWGGAIERRGGAPPPPPCNIQRRFADSNTENTATCSDSGTKTTTTSSDASRTDGSFRATDSNNDGGSGGNSQGGHGDADTSNQGNQSICRRSSANFGLGRRHAFGRRSPFNPSRGPVVLGGQPQWGAPKQWNEPQNKTPKANNNNNGKVKGDNVQGNGNTSTKQSTKTNTTYIDKTKNDRHDNHVDMGGSGDKIGNLNGNVVTCSRRRDNEEYEALEARMEDTGAQVLRAIGGMSRRHEDSPLEVLARRDMAMVAQALGVRASIFEDGSVYQRDSAPQLACDYEECGESERRDAEEFLRAHARDLGFNIIQGVRSPLLL